MFRQVFPNAGLAFSKVKYGNRLELTKPGLANLPVYQTQFPPTFCSLLLWEATDFLS